jgi:hypothetical protein
MYATVCSFPDYNEEEAEAEAKHDDTPSLSFSTTETLSSWMREANMDADIQSYTKSSILRRDEYFFRCRSYTSLSAGTFQDKFGNTRIKNESSPTKLETKKLSDKFEEIL